MEFQTKDYIHIGAELLLIGGVSAFFVKQNLNLKKQIADLQQDIEKLKNILQAHDQALGAIISGNPIPPPPQKPQPPQKPKQVQKPQKPQPPQKPQKPQKKKKIQSKPKESPRVREITPSEDEELENMEEFQELNAFNASEGNASRENKKHIKGNRLECKDDVCVLVVAEDDDE